jgi:predicted house-cleaning noncanonical NTP pyrophosphatase (MazG superfamily)
MERAMTVTELYSVMICEASNQKVRMARLEKYHQILEQYFAERLREYVKDHAPEVVAKVEGTDAEAVE